MASTAEAVGFVSVGYQGRDIDKFVTLLVDNHVDLLVDVRLNAISRKRGFSKTALSDALTGAGIEYRHQRELGNPKDNREPFRQGLPSARHRYVTLLTSAGSKNVFDEVVSLASMGRVALLCYERAHTECHRSCIIDAALGTDPTLGVIRI